MHSFKLVSLRWQIKPKRVLEEQEVCALTNTAVVIETMEMASLPKRDFGEDRIPWSVPWRITAVLEKWSSNLAFISKSF